jgi:hypothetical protein
MSASVDHSYVDMDVESGEKTFTIRNKGVKPLQIVSASQSNPSFLYTPSLTDIVGTVIEPDSSYTVTSKVNLTGQGEQSDTVTITATGLTDDPDSDRVSSWSGSSRVTATAIVTDATIQTQQLTSLGFKQMSSFTFPSIKFNETKTLKVYISKKSGKFPLKISSVTPVSVSSLSWDVSVSSGKLYTSTTSIGSAFTGTTLRLPRLFDKTADVAEYTITVKGKAPSEALRGRLDIVSNSGGKTGTTSISLSGSMNEGEISLYRTGQAVETSYSYGTINKGSSKTVSFDVENVGGFYLMLDIIKLSSSSTGASNYDRGTNVVGFDLLSLPSLPLLLAPGEKTTFQVKAVNQRSTSNNVNSGGSDYGLSSTAGPTSITVYLCVYNPDGDTKKITLNGSFSS